MEEDKIPEDYLKGYNQGYLLAKYVSQFSVGAYKELAESTIKSPRMRGMIDGTRQYGVDRLRVRAQERIPTTTKNNTPPKSSPDVNR